MTFGSPKHGVVVGTVTHGPCIDAIGAAANSESQLRTAENDSWMFAWAYCALDRKRNTWRAESKGYWTANLWGVWREWLPSVKLTRLDICMDVVGPMPPMPAREDGWKITMTKTGVQYEYTGTEWTWRIYFLEDDAGPAHRPVQYLASLEDAGITISGITRYECELHSSMARQVAELESAREAWPKLPRPPGMPIPEVDGEPVKPATRKTLPPKTAEEFAKRLWKYSSDSARRYAKRCGLSQQEFLEVAASTLRRAIAQWPSSPAEVNEATAKRAQVIIRRRSGAQEAP